MMCAADSSSVADLSDVDAYQMMTSNADGVKTAVPGRWLVLICVLVGAKTSAAWTTRGENQQSFDRIEKDRGDASRPVKPAKQKSLFSQPRFTKPERPEDATSSSTSPKNSRSRRSNVDSDFMALHQERVKTAGRVGSKRFVDPCKVFVGNLPYDADEAVLRTWLNERIGAHLPPAMWLHHINVVRDWKTGKSKGIGFVDFTQAHFATSAILQGNGHVMGNRTLLVKPGMRQPKQQVIVKKKALPAANPEEAAIQAGMAQAEAEAEEDDDLTPEAVAMLRRLDPDLLPEKYRAAVESGKPITFEEDDEDGYDGDELDFDFDDDDDDGEDDNFEYDGDYEGDDEELIEPDIEMNRAQRREAARKASKNKKPSRGFG